MSDGVRNDSDETEICGLLEKEREREKVGEKMKMEDFRRPNMINQNE
jgi:hypothetical protein